MLGPFNIRQIKMDSVSDIRREYTKAGLDVNDLTPEPFALFERWLHNAIDAKLVDPTAMTVATVDSTGQPSQRIVLLKDFDEAGFVFYTNFQSKKGQELLENPHILQIANYWPSESYRLMDSELRLRKGEDDPIEFLSFTGKINVKQLR